MRGWFPACRRSRRAQTGPMTPAAHPRPGLRSEHRSEARQTLRGERSGASVVAEQNQWLRALRGVVVGQIRHPQGGRIGHRAVGQRRMRRHQTPGACSSGDEDFASYRTIFERDPE